MGGSSSKNSTEVINEVINEAVAENIQKVSAVGSASQEITVTGNKNKVCKNEMGQTLSVIAKGDFNNALEMKTQNDIMAKLKASADASSNAFGALSGARAETDSKVTNIVKNSFTMKNMQDCLGDVSLKQKIGVIGDGNEVCENKMLQSAALVVDCVSKNTGVMTAINKVVADVETSAKSKNQGLLESLLGGCPDMGFGGAGTCLSLLALACLIGFGAYLYFTYQSENGGGYQPEDFGQDMGMDPNMMGDTLSPPNVDPSLDNGYGEGVPASSYGYESDIGSSFGASSTMPSAPKFGSSSFGSNAPRFGSNAPSFGSSDFGLSKGIEGAAANAISAGIGAGLAKSFGSIGRNIRL